MAIPGINWLRRGERVESSDGAQPKKHIRNIGWQFWSNLFTTLVSFVLFVFFSRYFSAEDFALFAVGILTTQLMWTLAQSGFTSLAYSIDFKNTRIASALFTCNVITSVSLCLIFSLLALAYYSNSDGVLVALVLLSVSFSAGTEVVNISLLREMRFRDVAIKIFIVQSISAAAAIIAALMGWGAWALLVQRLVGICIDVPMTYWLASWRPSLRTSSRATRLVMRSSTAFSLQAFISIVDNRIGEITTGLATSSLGLAIYRIATRVAETATFSVLQPITSVATAAIATTQQRADTVRYFQVAVLWAGALPFAGLVFYGDYAVYIVFGERWHSAGHILQLFSISFFVLGPTALLEAVLVAIGQSGRLVLIRLLSLLASVCSAAFILFFLDVEFIALVPTLKGILLLPVMLKWYRDASGLRYFEILRMPILPFFSTLLPIGLSRFMFEYISIGFTDWWALVLSIAICSVPYLALVYVLGWPQIKKSSLLLRPIPPGEPYAS